MAICALGHIRHTWVCAGAAETRPSARAATQHGVVVCANAQTAQLPEQYVGAN